MAAWRNVEIHNDVDNQQFSSLKFRVLEAALILSQHDKSVMLPRAVYLDESCLFTSTRRRTLLPFATRPWLACLNCKPSSDFLGLPGTASSATAGGQGTAGVAFQAICRANRHLPVYGTKSSPDKSTFAFEGMAKVSEKIGEKDQQGTVKDIVNCRPLNWCHGNQHRGIGIEEQGVPMNWSDV